MTNPPLIDLIDQLEIVADLIDLKHSGLTDDEIFAIIAQFNYTTQVIESNIQYNN